MNEVFTEQDDMKIKVLSLEMAAIAIQISQLNFPNEKTKNAFLEVCEANAKFCGIMQKYHDNKANN